MTKMPLTIDLPPGVWGAVERLARESGVTPEQFWRLRRRKRLERLPAPKPILKSELPALICNGSTHSWRERLAKLQTRTTLSQAVAAQLQAGGPS